MRTITIPKPVELFVNGEPKAYDFASFLAEFIWVDKRWRDEWSNTYEGLAELRLPSIPEKAAQISTGDWEKLKDMVKDVTVPPQFSTALMPFFHAVTRAPENP